MKKWLKKGVCIALAAVLTMSLAACGKGKDDSSGGGLFGGDKPSGGSASSKVDPSLAKQYVYALTEIQLPELAEGADLQKLAYIDGKVYALLYRYIWGDFGIDDEMAVYSGDAAADTEAKKEGTGDIAVEEPMEPFTGSSLELITMNPDGSDKNTVKLVLPEDVPQGDTWIQSSMIAADGSVYVVQTVSYEDSESTGEYSMWKQDYLLCAWDSQGNAKWAKAIEAGEEEWINVNFMVVDSQGNIQVGVMERELLVYSPEGELKKKTDLSIGDALNLGAIYPTEDGRLIYTSYDDSWTKMYLQEMDLATGTTKPAVEAPGFFTNFGINVGRDTDFILSSNTGLYTYNMGDAEPTQLMDYINSDLPSNNLNSVFFVDGEHFVASYYDIVSYDQKIGYFSYVKPEDIPDKETLVLGCNYVDSNVKTRIIAANKASDTYRITIRDYSQYATMDDWTAGYTRLNNDIVSGNVPDILVADFYNMDIEGWAKKGVLADIGEMIDKDPEMSRDDFLENVFKAYETNGKLYAVIPSFNVQSVIGKKSLLGDKSGWNMEEFKQFLSSYPDSTAFGTDQLRDSFLWNVMYYGGTELVDPKSGKCNFDTDEFKGYLEYANTLMANYEDNYWEDYQYDDSQWRNNSTLLQMVYINRIQDLLGTIKGAFGEDVTFVGFPTADKNGSILSCTETAFLISAKSKNQDLAWDFVRYYLTEEFQDTIYSLPVLKKSFDTMMKEATERPFWKDESGKKEYYDWTYWINEEEIILEPFTEEEARAIADYIKSVDKLSFYNNDIQNIIAEEAAPYFEGQKSVDEVAKIIQSRVQIFVDENS